MSDTLDIDKMLEDIMSKNKLPNIDNDVIRQFMADLTLLLKGKFKESAYNIDFTMLLVTGGADGQAIALMSSVDADGQEKHLELARKTRAKTLKAETIENLTI